MLTLLKIQNLALVDELLWEPKEGFLGITGETGAGKSVIMGGISLVLGERADKSLIRSGESQCCIEAIFHLNKPQQVNRLLDEAGVPLCEEGGLIIRRVITQTGNKQFINSTPVTLHLLRSIGTWLVDMHRPDAHRSLVSQERQMDLLDAFAEADTPLLQYRQAYQDWQTAHKAFVQAQESGMASERELDFLRHQVQEIESAAFTEEEASQLETRWQRARNASRLRDTALPMAQSLDGGQDALIDKLHQVIRQARDLERLDAGCGRWIEGLEEALNCLEDIAAEVQDYAETLESDPEELARLENRIALLDTLKRKYGADFQAITQHLEDCRSKLDALDNREEHLQHLADEETKKRDVLAQAATTLSAARSKAAPKLAADFLRHATQLGFRQSLFDVRLTPQDTPGPHGAESIEFFFGPNPGEPLKPLRHIASSGELARVMLALKSALAGQDDTPLLVFDEIDANVGGEIARAVGIKMRELGKKHQVIAITHFPQVAALADFHYLISKVQEAGRTVSQLRRIDGDARVSELVRMLGTSSESAEAHARELLSTPS
ncbi:MAG: DNA repair protein RecN [Akkermansia sp.]|nr:DNA repair protein RecN [Akkermansia sp.]